MSVPCFSLPVSYSCKECADGTLFESWRATEDHVAWEHFQLPYQCKHCSRVCAFLHDLLEHHGWRHSDERPIDTFYDRQRGWFEKKSEISEFIRFHVQVVYANAIQPPVVQSLRQIHFAFPTGTRLRLRPSSADFQNECFQVLFAEDILLTILSDVVLSETIRHGYSNDSMKTLAQVCRTWRVVVKSGKFWLGKQFILSLDDNHSLASLEGMLRRGIKISRVVGSGVVDGSKSWNAALGVWMSIHLVLECLESYQVCWKLSSLTVDARLHEHDLERLSGIMNQSMATLEDVKFGPTCDFNSLYSLLTILSHGECDKLKNLFISCDESGAPAPDEWQFPQIDIDGLNLVLTSYVPNKEFLWRLADICWYRDVISIQSLGSVGEKEPYYCIKENTFVYEPLNIQEIFPNYMFQELQYLRWHSWDLIHDDTLIAWMTTTFPKLREVFIDGCLPTQCHQLDTKAFISCFVKAKSIQECKRGDVSPYLKIFVGRRELTWDKHLFHWQSRFEQVSVSRFFPFKSATSALLRKDVPVHTIIYLPRAMILLFNY